MAVQTETLQQKLEKLVTAMAEAAEKLMDAQARVDTEATQQASDALKECIKQCLEYEDPDLLEMATYGVGLLPPAEGYKLLEDQLTERESPALKLAVYALPVQEAKNLLAFARDKNIEVDSVEAHGRYTLGDLMQLREKALRNFGSTPSP